MLAITIVIKNDKKVDYAKKKTLINITPVHNKDIHKALYFHRFKIFLILQHQTRILSLLLNFPLFFAKQMLSKNILSSCSKFPQQFICSSCASCFLSPLKSYLHQSLNSYNGQKLFKDRIHCSIHQIISLKFLAYNLDKRRLRQLLFWNP